MTNTDLGTRSTKPAARSTGQPAHPDSLRAVAEIFLESSGGLPPGEYELIAATVAGFDSPCRSDRLRALMNIAELASAEPARLLPEDAIVARHAGATDREVQDALLIGAAFWLVT